jgi:hypothetical protein
MAWLAGAAADDRPRPTMAPIALRRALDLGVGGRFGNHPDAEFGRRAWPRHHPGGAAGKRRRRHRSHAERLKGIGSASVVLPNGVTGRRSSPSLEQNVTAARAARLNRGIAGEARRHPLTERQGGARHWANPVIAPLNTTLAVIATECALASSARARRLRPRRDGVAMTSTATSTATSCCATAAGRCRRAVWGASNSSPPGSSDLRRRGGGRLVTSARAAPDAHGYELSAAGAIDRFPSA